MKVISGSTLFAFILILLVCVSSASAQGNFVGKDCDGQQHDLFAEIDNGSVTVLCWVMPCIACNDGADYSHEIVKEYQATHPGKVRLYLIDDYGNTTCAQLGNWAASRVIPKSEYCFMFSSSFFDMMNFGSKGMPKVVVIGGSEHKVYYNANNNIDKTALTTAVNTAVDEVTDVADDNTAAVNSIVAFPIPADRELTVVYNVAQESDVVFDLIDVLGEVVATTSARGLAGTDNTVSISTHRLPIGRYSLRVTSPLEYRIEPVVVSR